MSMVISVVIALIVGFVVGVVVKTVLTNRSSVGECSSDLSKLKKELLSNLVYGFIRRHSCLAVP